MERMPGMSAGSRRDEDEADGREMRVRRSWRPCARTGMMGSCRSLRAFWYVA